MPPWLHLSFLGLFDWARASVDQWPNVLGSDSWFFDQGSTFGYRLDGGSIHGPAPDWALGDGAVPVMRYQGPGHPGEKASTSTAYPGSILVTGAGMLQFSARLAFESENVSLVKLTLENLGAQPTWSWFNITGSGVNLSAIPTGGVRFALPKPKPTCFSASLYGQGQLLLVKSGLVDGQLQHLQWNMAVPTPSHFEALSEKVQLPAGKSLVTFALIVHQVSPPSSIPDAQKADQSFSQSITRWEGYLQGPLQHTSDTNQQWAAVKSIMTLLGNWRTVPGLPPGVLPSYVGYEGGFWSWDSYKQAVGMVHFAPQLAQDQLRLLASAQDAHGHIPDYVDRCGRGGGCNGKPPLLAWAVWEVFQKTQDTEFLKEMYPVVRDFHHFWYEHRDVMGVGLCSWTEGMESGMDDGVRFQKEFARSVSNASTHVTTLDFWSVDLNAYLYQEKRWLSQIATVVGAAGEAQGWAAAAKALLPRLQELFFVDGGRSGFFSDVYFNGSALPIKGCEGFAALFNGVATLPQALKVVETLRDPKQFYLNFSLPTVSKDNRFFNAHGYWKGPTWIDQTWFAYAGLRRYERLAKATRAEFVGPSAGHGWKASKETFAQLASMLKQKIFRGSGFAVNDTTPFTEHYDPDTGVAAGVHQFSWTAAHVLMWVTEADQRLDDVWI